MISKILSIYYMMKEKAENLLYLIFILYFNLYY